MAEQKQVRRTGSTKSVKRIKEAAEEFERQCHEDTLRKARRARRRAQLRLREADEFLSVLRYQDSKNW